MPGLAFCALCEGNARYETGVNGNTFEGIVIDSTCGHAASFGGLDLNRQFLRCHVRTV